MLAALVVLLGVMVVGLILVVLLLWDGYSTHKKAAEATFKALDTRTIDLNQRLETVERSTKNTAAWEESYFRPQGKKANAG